MKIDFHLHTKASFDCESEPSQIAEWAVKKGLNGLVVTDHDSTGGYKNLKLEAEKRGLFVIPGVEHTTSRGTHYLVYLTPELPLPSDDLNMIDEVHSRGGLVGIPHPYRSDTGLIYNQTIHNLYNEEEVRQIFSKVDMLEIHNGKSLTKENKQAKLLSEKFPSLIKIAGSDSHHSPTIGGAHTEIPGFIFGAVREMQQQLKTLPTKIVVLPELTISDPAKTFKKTIEGTRRLMVKFKPVIPSSVWESGRSVYRRITNRLAEKRASKSVLK